jgi:hypothetical protein
MTYRSLPGEPRFIAEMSDWDFSVTPMDADFTLPIPPGAGHGPHRGCPIPLPRCSLLAAGGKWPANSLRLALKIDGGRRRTTRYKFAVDVADQP